MAPDAASGSLTLSLAAAPMEGDAVVESAGALLFLDPEAAVILDNKTIDADTGPGGQMTFMVAE
jgi:Fe-S cluster assembly iron-binding protein IscA